MLSPPPKKREEKNLILGLSMIETEGWANSFLAYLESPCFHNTALLFILPICRNTEQKTRVIASENIIWTDLSCR